MAEVSAELLLSFRLRMESLISQREGMIAENMQREAIGESMAYGDGDFDKVAKGFTELDYELQEVRRV